jgi:glycosyltransferase involved in cell wall biosynthesis
LNNPAVDYYFQRFGFCPAQITAPPSAQLGLVIVIPCYNEPTLTDSLDALWHCERPACDLEVIIVINSAENSPPSVLQHNQQTLDRAELWISEHKDPRTRFHCLHFPNLPRKKAGVGLARKIGMDEALHRLAARDRLDRPILCFDADCTCDPNYLIEVEQTFDAHPHAPGASIYFEHPLEGPEDPRLYDAVTEYELHLRYYVEALRYAGFPHAFHTIGSSMAVRARVYMEQGGMNKRQAGEDFYFLHKIIPLGSFREINSTRVIASPRPSDRVPFGTGRAVRDFLDSGKFESYPLQAFEDLRSLFANLPALYESDAPLADCPLVLQQFLNQQNAARNLALIREHTATQLSFQRRFFRWFDGFLAMKYIHSARDRSYGPAEIKAAARELYQHRAPTPIGPRTTRDLLLAYRELQRTGRIST